MSKLYYDAVKDKFCELISDFAHSKTVLVKYENEQHYSYTNRNGLTLVPPPPPETQKPAESGPDMVNNPGHYTWHPSGVEAIKIIEVFPHNLAAAMGYIWRSDHKGEFARDIKKAIWHLQRELARREVESSH